MCILFLNMSDYMLSIDAFILFVYYFINILSSTIACVYAMCKNSINGIFVILLTHWGRVTHICRSKVTIIGSDNGLSPSRRQAIIWTNAGILLIRPLGTNFNEL